MKNQKGITLVALVVTIIVLLILAGVSLSLVMGNEGICFEVIIYKAPLVQERGMIRQKQKMFVHYPEYVRI